MNLVNPNNIGRKNHVCGLSSEERERLIEKFRSFEVENVKPIFEDTEEWLTDKDLKSLELVGGLDISYHKTKSDVASVSLVVLSYPELELVYEDTTIEDITVPYIPGYLAYREAEHFHKKLEQVKKTNFSPQVILVDGNGALHPRRYGSAVKVGVDADLPTIGVAKNLMVMEEFGICRDKIGEIKAGGGTIDITSNDGYLMGKAVRTTDTSHKPVFVSVGHKCSLDSAVRIVLGCCRTRIPEPIRQADHLSKMKLKVTPR